MKKKPHIIREDAKAKHTAHWDWDYLTWEEIEQRLSDAGIDDNKQTLKNKNYTKKRKFIYATGVGLGLLIVGLLVLISYS